MFCCVASSESARAWTDILPFELEALDHPDPERLGEDRQAVSDLVDKDIRDGMRHLHVSFRTPARR